MAINENSGTRQQARIHAHPFAGVDLDGHETLPLVAVALERGAQFAQKILLELDDFLDIHADQQRFGSSDAGFDHKEVLKVTLPGSSNAREIIDFKSITQIQVWKTCDVQNLSLP